MAFKRFTHDRACIANPPIGVQCAMSEATAPSKAAEKIWFITGSSTGFGRELAEQLLALGASVVATARKPEQLAALQEKYGHQVLTLALDVTQPEQIDAAVEAAIAQFGRIDVLVNNAGYGVVGALEEATADEYRPMFETNVFGLIRMTQAVLPGMRAQRSGHILNLSSIGGLIATPGLAYYNASKFAVEALSEALTGELAPLGIQVTVVEPGPFRTDFLGRSGVRAAQEIPDYSNTAGNARKYFDHNDGKQAGDPVRAVKAMIAAVEAPVAPKHMLLGKSAFERFSTRLDLWRTELEAGHETAVNADFPAGE